MYEHKQLFDSMIERIEDVGAEHGLSSPQAFPRWFAEMYFEEPQKYFPADGPGDGKVDLFFNTSNGKDVCHHVLNTKFTDKYNSTAPVSFYNEITSFWQAFRNKANQSNYLAKVVRKELRPHYARLFEHYQAGRARLYFLTNHCRNDRQNEAVKNYDVEIFHLEDLLQFMADYVENAMPHTAPLRLTGISNILSADQNETEVPTSIVFARLTDFIDYMKQDRYELLFNRNVRLWLGNTEVNKAISKTFQEHPKEFAYSNNGITLLCESHVSHQGKHEVVVNNPRVVNGSQTLHSVRDVPDLKSVHAARVMVRIIEVPPLGANNLPHRAERRKEIIRKIALRSNSQNNIKKWDLVSNDDFQLNLARHFRTKRLFYERRKREWLERRTELKGVGVRRGPEIKSLAQLIASFYWDNKLLGPIAAKNPAELFEDQRYDQITEIASETVYQLFLLDGIITTHVRELSRLKRYISNAAKPMKLILFALIVRSLQSANTNWSSEEFSKQLETEFESPSKRWRVFALTAIEYIRDVYVLEDRKYRKREKQQLSVVNYFKAQAYVNKIFLGVTSNKLRAAARAVI
jgi:hypothetical protein